MIGYCFSGFCRQKRFFRSIDYGYLLGKDSINVKFEPSTSGKVFTTHNPFNGLKIGEFPNSSEEDASRAIELAQSQFSSYRTTPNSKRAELLFCLSDKILDHKDSLSRCITLEMGKPISESRIEVDTSIKLLKWFGEETRRIHGRLIDPGTSKKLFILHKPHGVVSLISPWNFPLNMIVRSLGAALGAGCTVVAKPSSDTPLGNPALLLSQIVLEAGFPKGVFNVVTSDSESSKLIGRQFCSDHRVRHLSFTGSTDVGRHLLNLSANTIKRCSMELGGSAPFIVFPSADIDLSVECLMHAKFRNAGQTCISANRIFLHETIYEEFLEKLKSFVSALNCGDPTLETTKISCLYSEKGFKKVRDLVESALKEGSKCYFQGEFTSGCSPCFYPPTILTECRKDMKIARSEIFGPVCAIYKFSNDSEVLDDISQSSYGLAAYIYSQNLSQIMKTIERLDFGLVAVNDSSPSNYLLPFGGHKESGVGSEMGSTAIYQYLDTQSVVLNHS